MSVMLGTIDEHSTTESFSLTSRFFPSKVGGKPAWLDLKHIPEASELACLKCNIPLVFLCQLYAPIDEPEFRGSCFHRTLYVFYCNECKGGRTFAVFRSQLRKKNDYYSGEPAEPNDPDITPDMWGIKLCKVCGCKSTVEYENIYCSLHHKNIDLNKELRDKFIVVLPEHIINEESDEGSENASLNSEDDDSDYSENSDEAQIPKGSLQDMDGLDEALLEMAYGGDKDDEYFEKFKKSISSVPEQIIRYNRLESPLWICTKRIPEAHDIPSCQYCGKQRSFEFQVMPQMLYYLKLPESSTKESFNFGILAVYTCPASCEAGQKYKKEFLWEQSPL
ncbi:programmed cell death protein 2 [Acyrthosiphon pisum]|uniref:Programmed cell death protein 2 C-terminal domain-containing protein n=1 Tax=Acyrthosiphon pisum TaxID=7029 RepID=A0A8R2FBW2_ACYPI|nr:programmed cell death protein 2 [Acyrthosiphon pisum]XP_016663147.1 programmed cell death protein 2 [Acyrthosiphon pisum]|eukprot:XP_008187026.1 PREDICTED: programmed cell death protein 2 [Acyrthosiphon pisum]